MALEDVLEAAVVRPVHAAFLDINGDPVRGWSGPGTFLPTSTGDPDLDGETFLSVQGAVDISEIKEDQGIGGPVTITFGAGDLDDDEIFQQLVVDRRRFQARKAKIWLFFLTEDESSVASEFTTLFNGVMVGANTERSPGEPARIKIKCDQDLQGRRQPPTLWAAHQTFYSSDTASTFFNSVNRGGVASGSTPGSSTPAAGTGLVPPGSTGSMEEYRRRVLGRQQ